MSQKVTCPMGHVVGAVSGNRFESKHRQRVVSVEPEHGEKVNITVTCEKCKQKVVITLPMPRKKNKKL